MPQHDASISAGDPGCVEDLFDQGQSTTGKERRITHWEHEDVLEIVQQRLDADPQATRRRRETVEHPFGTIKARMGATHFLMKTLPKFASEMALSVLAYKSDARHEYRQRQAADSGDRGWLASAIAMLRPHDRLYASTIYGESEIPATNDQNVRLARQLLAADRCGPRHSVIKQPRPDAELASCSINQLATSKADTHKRRHEFIQPLNKPRQLGEFANGCWPWNRATT